MPLIHKKLLQETTTKHKHEIPTSSKQGLLELFQITLNRIETGKFGKEESEKVPFLQKMFELLGYKLHENLEFEFSINGRSIDGVLGLQIENIRKVEVAIEWKGINTKSLDSGKAGETPVSQMWDYMGKSGAEIGIVGNFLEFRIYTLKTKQSQYQEYFLRELAQKEDKLDEFIFLLKKSTLLKNENKNSILETLIDQTEAQQEQITKRFYADYKQKRLHLFEHLVEHNTDKDKHLLLEKAQKVLDRLIFVMFCEDDFLIPSSTIRNTYKQARETILPSQTKVWDFFKGLFFAIDKGNDYPKINAFNGGLFAEDLDLNSLIIKDEIWKDLIQLAEYDFASDLNVNILGHIFEQSINDIEEIKASLTGQTADKKKSKRKKDGIYYTPEYITDYIVSETVGSWLSNETNKLETIKILDPAGGSGAFPNQVHNFLTKQYVQKQNQIATDQGFENFVQDENTIDKSILKNNIFMVDLQPESVEIAKLSLWLKTAKKDQKLNNLDQNIKCGNSLIDDPEIAGSSAFDWEKEFPEVIAGGGFDVIVGNPPYISYYSKFQANAEGFREQTEWMKENYTFCDKKAVGRLNSQMFFFEKGLKLLKDGGYVGFIVDCSFYEQNHRDIRKFILENCSIVSVIREMSSFEEVNSDQTIIILKKGMPEKDHKIKWLEGFDSEPTKVKQRLFLEHPDFAFYNNTSNKIVAKIDEQNFSKLGDICNSTIGIQIGGKNLKLEDKSIDELFLFSDEAENKVRNVSDFTRYGQTESVNYLLLDVNLGRKVNQNVRGANIAIPNNIPFIGSQKIIIRQSSSVLTATISKKQETGEHKFFFFIPEGFNLKYILGILNSKIATYYALKKEIIKTGIKKQPQIRIKGLRQLPIPKATPKEQTQIAELVDRIIELKKTSQNLTNSFVKLITAKYKPATISTKLKNWHKLEIADFLDELKKQKAVIGSLSAESELMGYFEEQKIKVQEVEKEAERVEGEIEGLVRGLYGV